MFDYNRFVEDLKIDNSWSKYIQNYCLDISRRALIEVTPSHHRHTQPMVLVHFSVSRKIPPEHFVIQQATVTSLRECEVDHTILAAVFRGLNAS